MQTGNSLIARKNMKNRFLIFACMLPIFSNAHSAMQLRARPSLRQREHRMNNAHRNRQSQQNFPLALHQSGGPERKKRRDISIAILAKNLPILTALLQDSTVPYNLNHNELINDYIDYQLSLGAPHRLVNSSPFTLLKGQMSPLEFAARGKGPQAKAMVNTLLWHGAIPSPQLCQLVVDRGMHEIIECFLAHGKLDRRLLTAPRQAPLINGSSKQSLVESKQPASSQSN
jgi:hypothetical protein